MITSLWAAQTDPNNPELVKKVNEVAGHSFGRMQGIYNDHFANGASGGLTAQGLATRLNDPSKGKC